MKSTVKKTIIVEMTEEEADAIIATVMHLRATANNGAEMKLSDAERAIMSTIRDAGQSLKILSRSIQNR